MLMLKPVSYRFTPWEPQTDTNINEHLEIMEIMEKAFISYAYDGTHQFTCSFLI